VEEDALAYTHGVKMVDGLTSETFREFAIRAGETADWPGLADCMGKQESGSHYCVLCKIGGGPVGITKSRLGILDYTGAANDALRWAHADYVQAGRQADAAWAREQEEMRKWMVAEAQRDGRVEECTGWLVGRKQFAVEGVKRVPSAALLDRVYSNGYDVTDRTWHDGMHICANLVGVHAFNLIDDPTSKYTKPPARPTKATVIAASPAGDPLKPLTVLITTSLRPRVTYMDIYVTLCRL
jgi:hypothetical protein